LVELNLAFYVNLMCSFLECIHKWCFRWQPSASCGWFCFISFLGVCRVLVVCLKAWWLFELPLISSAADPAPWPPFHPSF